MRQRRVLLWPQGAAAHAGAQPGSQEQQVNRMLQEQGLTLISTRLEVSLTQMSTEHREPWAQTEPQNHLGSGPR